MAKIDFRNKINWRRRFRSPPRVETERDILRIFESDRGRIVNSPAIRRLQQKTQVFPLERNAAVRTRLTHSLEVQQVGRYIAKEVLSRLKELRLLEEYGLEELTGPFESVVEDGLPDARYRQSPRLAILAKRRLTTVPSAPGARRCARAAADRRSLRKCRPYACMTERHRLMRCAVKCARISAALRATRRAFVWSIR
ncbi:deoxyguanosinetriphosphate triphosphohydrolase [Klebsiella pneumoniae subsp. ozaenae]|uniref:Deoxyguanosinetriphosphate triphosphohydrolase n=1 Tax=Klebsiella pneumoniae subsp. ozaenae TaxID=574 RepID=A0A378C0R4_KLEPO|nr:deoxyguanosinetriphosphate triphosphohydrolase [Klebsiella pneumoniae subsp. ozaenae]